MKRRVEGRRSKVEGHPTLDLGLWTLDSRARGEREAGLTLVELLIALALLGFVLLGITPLFMASVKSNYAGNEYTSINMLARDRLEQLMNLPFNDAQLQPGKHPNDLPTTLPDPTTGLPPAPGPGAVKNPFSVCYQVFQLQIPSADLATVAQGAPFTPISISAAGQIFQYKRIDITVTSSTGQIGIGTRMTRVSGVVSNPFPATNLSQVDLGGSCP
jgi:type II secretory pathway pseudopilin PulG